jgi:hypothetical protein
MADQSLPYLNAYGNITKGLEKIKTAETPDRFSHDFLADTLGMTGGGARPLVSYLKRTGFLGSDGIPTEQYKSFRNPSQSHAAAAQALRTGYAPLFKMDEAAHKLDDAKLKGFIVQATGLEANSTAVRAILGSFKALRAFAGDAEPEPEAVEHQGDAGDGGGDGGGTGGGDSAGGGEVGGQLPAGVGLSYTINLHLPATSEIAVFNAIFRSLRENLLR